MTEQSQMMIATAYLDHSHKTPVDQVVLSYDERFLRRKTVGLVSGRQLLINLAQITSLNDGGSLVTMDGAEVVVVAAVEPLLKVTGSDLARLAWHIGNRHTPCQISQACLLIQRDPVIAHMLEQLGARIEDVDAPFSPEGGAYGHGRTHSHEHGKSIHAQ